MEDLMKKILFSAVVLLTSVILFQSCQDQIVNPVDNSETHRLNAAAPGYYSVIATENNLVGFMTVYNDETDFYIHWNLLGDKIIEDISISIVDKLEELPSWPAPEDLAHHFLSLNVKSYQETFPISPEDFDCGKAFFIVAHLTVRYNADGESHVESAWCGISRTSGKTWWSFTPYTLLCMTPRLMFYYEWKSGDAYSEKEQARLYGGWAWKVEGAAPDGFYNTNSGKFGNQPTGTEAVITISNSDGKNFDWSISEGYEVMAVIVKGGQSANVYLYYRQNATSGTGLQAPVNIKNGRLTDIGHVTFCFIKTP
jgi:hypothetical protein